MKTVSFKKLVVVALVLLSSFGVQAQQEEQMSLYMYNPLYYNPAYAGSRNTLNATVLGRFQWVGLKGAPQTQWVSVHAPLASPRIGLGVHLVNDKIGNSNRTGGYLDLSGNVPLNKKSRLAVGLTGGADFMSFDYASALVNDSNDPTFGVGNSKTEINVGAGIYYYGSKGYAGVSSPRLVQKELAANNKFLLVARHYYFTAGYIVKISPRMDFKPSVLVKTTVNAPTVLDINTSFLYNNKVWFGAMYRYNQAIGVNINYLISGKFSVGYAFDFQTNDVARSGSSSHEIVLQYEMKKSSNRDGLSPRYF